MYYLYAELNHVNIFYNSNSFAEVLHVNPCEGITFSSCSVLGNN